MPTLTSLYPSFSSTARSESSTTDLYKVGQYLPSCVRLPHAGHNAPSAVYGAEHLLRLLSQLPNLLIYTDLEPDELLRLQAKLPELHKFLLLGRSEFFLGAYKLREATLSARSLSKKASKQDKEAYKGA